MKPNELLGRILQIGIHDGDDGSSGVHQAGGNCGLMAKVAGETDYLHPWIGGTDLLANRERPVTAPIIDDEELKFFVPR